MVKLNKVLKDRENRIYIIISVLVILIASLPLMNRYCIQGHDSAYHLLRIEALKEGYIVIFSGGTGNPYFTTDSASALRGVEIEADILLKGTRVDGIYTADPEKDPTATKFSRLTFDETISKNLKVMDLTAFALCKENNLPIMVFDMNGKDNFKKIVEGDNSVGTLVSL